MQNQTKQRITLYKIDIQQQHKVLYRIWCRIFFNDVLRLDEKKKKISDYHIAIIDHIVANDYIDLEEIKKNYKQMEVPVYQLMDGLLLTQSNRLIKLNSLFLQNVPKLITRIRNYLEIQKQMCGSSQQQLQILLCRNCLARNDSYLLNMYHKCACENCGSIKLRKPQKDLLQLKRCEQLQKKIQTFEKLKQSISTKILNKHKYRKIKLQKQIRQNTNKSRLWQIYQQSLNIQQNFKLSIQQQQTLRKYLIQNDNQIEISKRYFNQNIMWPKKFKSIKKKIK